MSSDATNLSFKNNDGKPKLFSLNNHRQVLENKRTNVYLDSSSIKPPQFQKGPSPLLSSLFSNPPRTMTPSRPRLTDMSNRTNNTNTKDFAQESQSSNEHAYYQFKPSRLAPRSTETPSPDASIEAQHSEHFSHSHSNQIAPFSMVGEEVQRYKSPVVARDQWSKEEKQKIFFLYTQASQNLDDCQLRLEEVQAKSNQESLELRQIRSALSLARETLASKEAELSSTSKAYAETKSALSDLREKYTTLTEALNKETTERQRLENGTTHLKSRLSQMSALQAELAEAFKELKKNHNTSTNQIHDFAAEITETKRLARSGLASLEPLLNDEEALARGHAKETLKELSDALSKSHQVTDILRDRLFQMSNDLCTAQGRVKELEDEKRQELRQILAMKQEERAHFMSFTAVEEHLAELSHKLSIRERESIDCLARATVLEHELEAAKSELQSSKIVQGKLSNETEALRAEKDGNVATIAALQNTIVTQDKELISLKAEVKALTESKAELRALLAESKKDLSQKIQELESRRDPNPDLVEKIKELEDTVASLTHDSNESRKKHVEERLEILSSHQTLENQIRAKLHEAETAKIEILSRNSSLEESREEMRRELEMCRRHNDEIRSESKKTYERDMKEIKGRLEVQSVNLFQSKEECITLKEQLKALHEKLSMTQSALEKTEKTAAEVQSVNLSLFQSKEECTTLKEQLKALHDKFSMTQSALEKTEKTAALMSQLQEKRAVDSDAIVSGLRDRLERTTAELEAVKFQLEEAEGRLTSAKEAAIYANQMNIHQLNEQAKMDQAKIAKLERKCADLVEASDNIIRRYNSGLLTEIEKKFVGCIMDQADRIHAEGVAKKDNELRRRQIMVDDLKAKNAELQTALARLLKEKEAKDKETQPGTLNKSIVGLKNWVSSSPAQNEDQVFQTHGRTLAATSISHMLAPTHVLAHPAEPSEPGKDKGLESSCFHDNVDSDDDIPLSKLHPLPEDPVGGENGSGNKRTRPPSSPAVDEPNQTKKRPRMPSNQPQKEKEPRKAPEASTAKAKQRKRK